MGARVLAVLTVPLLLLFVWNFISPLGVDLKRYREIYSRHEIDKACNRTDATTAALVNEWRWKALLQAICRPCTWSSSR